MCVLRPVSHSFHIQTLAANLLSVTTVAALCIIAMMDFIGITKLDFATIQKM